MNTYFLLVASKYMYHISKPPFIQKVYNPFESADEGNRTDMTSNNAIPIIGENTIDFFERIVLPFAIAIMTKISDGIIIR